MTANRLSPHAFLYVFLSRLLPLLALALACATALAQSDPPARVGSLSHIEGSVVLAPAGDTEWTDAVLNRPVTRGDRLWTDPGARAELHLGSAVLHLDDQTFLDVTALDDNVLQASLNEGTVNARVRRLDAGENFEIDTPNLAFRAAQPGDYRIDVDPDRGATRVTVRSGLALVYGAKGESQQVHPGQQLAFGGRDLERVALPPLRNEGFDRWAAERNQREDQAIAARYVPRDVVGYHQLDAYGSWVQDPTYGAVWFPRITVADWAPYRYGHWEWIRPWGWTWIDDAPWGFAPFHYGRWAVIGSRWCWVPGRLGPRPIYAPALVAFVGGGSGTSWSLTIGSGPGIAWYPLAPGEAWQPFYRASPVYVRNVNRYIVVQGDTGNRIHVHQRRPDAVTAVGLHDFSRGRPVHRHWSRVNPSDLARAPLATPPALPEPGRGSRVVQPRAQPPVHSVPPAVIARPPGGAPGFERRGSGDHARPGFRSQEEWRQPPGRRRDEQRAFEAPRGQPQVRQEERRERFEERQDERRAREEQRRQQAQQLQLQQQERARRDQQMQLERGQGEQQMQVQRQIEEQRRAQQAQIQREHAVRQQQAAQERMQRQQEMQQQRAAQQAQMQREHAQRQQQAAQERMQRQQEMQERAAQQGQMQRDHALRQQQAAQERMQRQQAAQERIRQQQEMQQRELSGPPRSEGRDSREDRRRQAQERHEQRRSQRGDEGRERGPGQGRGG